MSDDGEHGLTIIAFIGSVFSPYYAASRRRGTADPTHYCALNVALYGPRGKYWAMTERRRTALSQSRDSLAIGNSAMSWSGGVLTIEINERTIPRFSPLAGCVRLYPSAITEYDVALDNAGRHVWRPIAPRAHIDVQMKNPQLRWCGSGYFDTNQGQRPLEADFSNWTWSRTETASGALIVYDVLRREAEPLELAVHFDRDGIAETVTAPQPVVLPKTGWRISRTTRSDRQDGAVVLRTLEDTPFYARSLIATELCGERRVGMHESLSLDRFRSRWVQALLPFRMPRAMR